MGADTGHLPDAIAEWRSVLGDAAVDARAETLARYGRSTNPAGRAPSCVLRLRGRDDVAAALRIANKYEQPVHPIARGKNWGYGDACPPVDGCVLLDLSGMDRIHEVNAELGYVVIEPGVSQGQLFETLQREVPQFWMDATGAGPDASVVGNALQRGFGHTAYADHVRSMCGLEVVLADGTVLNTGFGRFENARSARVFPYGLGPHLDGLFTQSNLAIVTKVGLWLQPKPEAFAFFWIKVKGVEVLPRLVDALRPLRMSGVLRSALHIGNDLRVISAARAYPWQETGGAAPLPQAERARLRDEIGCGDWNVSGSIVGTPVEVRDGARRLRAAVRGLGRVVVLNDRRMAWLRRASGLLAGLGLAKGLRMAIVALEENYSLLQGRPNFGPLKGMLWRVRERDAAPPRDLLDTNAGLLWAAPVLPLRGADAQELLGIAEPILARHGFDPLVTFTMLNERAMVCIMNISFDKTLPEEAQAATLCQTELKGALAAQGFYPYRASSLNHAAWFRDGDAYNNFCAKLKHAVDPKGIISPGLYFPEGPAS